uniref:Uncharacterized protein n=1 Tax=Clastoptera arizonana TaxID=38151 RepID=A0A1B6E8I8_9HEMI
MVGDDHIQPDTMYVYPRVHLVRPVMVVAVAPGGVQLGEDAHQLVVAQQRPTTVALTHTAAHILATQVVVPAEPVHRKPPVEVHPVERVKTVLAVFQLYAVPLQRPVLQVICGRVTCVVAPVANQVTVLVVDFQYLRLVGVIHDDIVGE